MSDTVIPTESIARTSALPARAGAGAARASAKSPAAKMVGRLGDVPHRIVPVSGGDVEVMETPPTTAVMSVETPLTVPLLCRRRAGGPGVRTVRTVLMRMVAAGLRAGSSGTRPDVKRPGCAHTAGRGSLSAPAAPNGGRRGSPPRKESPGPDGAASEMARLGIEASTECRGPTVSTPMDPGDGKASLEGQPLEVMPLNGDPVGRGVPVQDVQRPHGAAAT